MATARVERRLAAILAADVVGYSRLMERDEAGTLARLKAHRKELIEPLLAEHRGRIVKLMGDGALCRVRQRRRRGRVRGRDPAGHGRARGGRARGRAHPLPHRHQPRRRDPSRRTGTSTATASTSPPGSSSSPSPAGSWSPARPTTTSGASSAARFESLGEQRLKNIERPVQGLPDGPRRRRRRAAGAARAAAARQALDRGAAVRQPERRPGAGLLRRRHRRGHHHRAVPRLAACSSSPATRASPTGARPSTCAQVGRELGVRYVLEGSVRKAGERVRITGQLIEAATGAHLWADRFDGTLEDVFDLQDRVADGVAGAIEPTLRAGRDRARPAQADRRASTPTTSTCARCRTSSRPRRRPTARRCGCSTGRSRSTRTTPRRSGSRPGATCSAYLRSWAGDDETERAAGERAARRALASGQDDPTALAMGGFVRVAAGARPRGGARGAGPGAGAQPELRAGARLRRPGALLRRGLRHGDRARPAGAAPEPARPAELQAADRAGLRPPLHRPARGGGGVRGAGGPGEPRVRRLATRCWWRAWSSSGGWRRRARRRGACRLVH